MFGYAFAVRAGGYRADGVNMGQIRLRGFAQDKFGDRPVVIDRLCIGHARNGCEASGHGGGRAGDDGFLVFQSGLAQVHMHIDKSRRDDKTCKVNDFRTGWCFEGRSARRYFPFSNHNVPARVCFLRRVDYPGAF